MSSVHASENIKICENKHLTNLEQIFSKNMAYDLLNQLNIGVVVVDKNGIIVDFNEAFLNQKGLSLQNGNLIGKSSQRLKNDKNRLLALGNNADSNIGIWNSLNSFSFWSGLHLDYSPSGIFNLQGTVANTLYFEGEKYYVLYSQLLNNLLLGSETDYSMWVWGHDLNNAASILGNVLAVYFSEQNLPLIGQLNVQIENLINKIKWLQDSYRKVQHIVPQDQLERRTSLKTNTEKVFKKSGLWIAIIEKSPFPISIIEKNSFIFKNEVFKKSYYSTEIDSMLFDEVRNIMNISSSSKNSRPFIFNVYLDESSNRIILYKSLSRQFIIFSQDMMKNLLEIKKLTSEIDPKGEKENRGFNILDHTINRMIEMVNEMILVAQNNMIQKNGEIHHIKKVIEYFNKHLFELKIGDYPVYFESDISNSYLSSTWQWVGNLFDLERVIENLIKNAQEALKDSNEMDGYVDVHFSIEETGGNENEKKLKITIEDNGPGILREIIDSNEFVSNGFTTKKYGTGTGLVNVKKIVKSLNGTIKVENKVIKGTRFTITFPISKKYYAQE
ncbi:MAG: GHKL domain-containing protein [Halobacteriovoraceae bacterium]|nr:GHKL domain-containing protein [Halobacteriovoraceae bacterium]